MEWDMLEESKKLFPHWLDKTDNSNFTKHLSILNNQQLDIRHKIRTLSWARLLNKPLQIHKIQTEPHKWKIEFEANIPRLKTVNIYKNPTIVNNQIVDNPDVVFGYYYEGQFYKNHSKEIKSIPIEDETEDIDNTYEESEISVSESYFDLIELKENNHYFDLLNEQYYKYRNGVLVEEDDSFLKSSLIYSESFIDNHSKYFKYIHYEDNSNEIIIQKFILDEDNNQKYKQILNYNDNTKNGKYELCVINEDNPQLYYNITTKKYCVLENEEYVEIDDENIHILTDTQAQNTTFIGNENTYYVITKSLEDKEISRIPLIENEDITPIITNDKYVLEVFTWNDYHYLKGFPEIDFIDYNNNNIIDDNEKNYDNLNITIENISDVDYLTFRVHQFGIKLVEVFKDEKPIHVADFVIEKLNFSNKTINSNFAHIYNYNNNEVYYPYEKDTDSLEEIQLDVDEYVWRLRLSDEDKIFDKNGDWNYELKNKYDIKVTYYDPYHPYDSDYDKILMKTYVYEDSIFYHDISLDMLGNLYNVHRYVFKQPSLETPKEQIDYYSKTYPQYNNTLSEDDYHYQKRLLYYINNYNEIYFPVLELWKYFHIDSELINRKVILSEQNYSYMRTLSAEEDKYINELSKNKLDSYFLDDEYVSEEEEKNLNKPKLKSIISPDDYLNSRNGILIDSDNNYIRDVNGTPIRTDYVYNIEKDEQGNDIYVIQYHDASRTFTWYVAKENDNIHQISLTKSLKVVPNTKYQLRFCLKEYPNKKLNLKIIYKNENGDIREVVEKTPSREDYDEVHEYNEIIYTNYKKEWGISCEYICTDFVTLETANNIEIILESEATFKISDVTLQRVTINHFDSEYMRTSTDYNSCVYDLYADYTKIPSNLKYDDLSIFNKVLNRSLPLTKVGYFNFMLKDVNREHTLKLDTNVNISLNNLLDVESNNLSVKDWCNVHNPTGNVYEYTYNFKKYIKTGDYTIYIKSYFNKETNTINDFKIDVIMLMFNEDNTAVEKTLTIENMEQYYVNDGEEDYFKIPFKNESDNSLKIRIYRDERFKFKNFKLIRESPLTMEELSR